MSREFQGQEHTKAEFSTGKLRSVSNSPERSSTPPAETPEQTKFRKDLIEQKEIEDGVDVSLDALSVSLGLDTEERPITPQITDTILWRVKNMKPEDKEIKEYFLDVAKEVLTYREVLSNEQKTELLHLKELTDRTVNNSEDTEEFGFETEHDNDTTDKLGQTTNEPTPSEEATRPFGKIA